MKMKDGRTHLAYKAECYQAAYRTNRRRVNGNRGKVLQRKRSELPERSFAHVCETGGARRTWIRGREEINKRYLIQVAARNLGEILRRICGVGTPRSLHGKGHSLNAAFWVRMGTLLCRWWGIPHSFRPVAEISHSPKPICRFRLHAMGSVAFSTAAKFKRWSLPQYLIRKGAFRGALQSRRTPQAKHTFS